MRNWILGSMLAAVGAAAAPPAVATLNSSMALSESLPAAIESFVQRRSVAARRIQICHDEQRIVLRRGWLPLAADCAPEPGDEVMPLSE